MDKNLLKRSFRTALFCAAGMTAFFLLMKALGLAGRIELHFFNLLIFIAGIRSVMWQVKEVNNGYMPYLPGLSAGFFTALATSVLFGTIIFIYFSYFDPALLAVLQSDNAFGLSLTPGAMVLSIVLEGTSFGLILSFIFIQMYKWKKDVAVSESGKSNP